MPIHAFGQLASHTRTIETGKTTTTQYNYNLRGELISQTGDIGGLNFNTQTAYDAFGRITQSIDGAGKVTTTSYQNNGRAIEVTDPLDRKVRSEYDAFARVLKTIDASGQSTTTPTTTSTAASSERRLKESRSRRTRPVTVRSLNVVDGRGNTTALPIQQKRPAH